MTLLRRWLAHPLTNGLGLDDPRTTTLRRQIILSKPFLRHIYQDWYARLVRQIPSGAGAVLELGSGAGFLADVLPQVITSEMFLCPNVQVLLNGCDLPLGAGALKAILMVDVFHHIPQCRRFLTEAARCVRPGGTISMVEPWVTKWSHWVYPHLHHEPFQPDQKEWEFQPVGPLSGANGALPWIVFERDRTLFEYEYPQWQILSVEPLMPFRYLVSGGVSLRSLQPGWMSPFWRAVEHLCILLNPGLAMFAQVTLRRLVD